MPYKRMARLDRMIHEPARLAIMSTLKSCQMAQFLTLQEIIGLTKGNLSSHLSKLEKVNYIMIEKQFVRRKIPNTTIRITHIGEQAVVNYWKEVEKIMELLSISKNQTNSSISV